MYEISKKFYEMDEKCGQALTAEIKIRSCFTYTIGNMEYFSLPKFVVKHSITLLDEGLRTIPVCCV